MSEVEERHYLQERRRDAAGRARGARVGGRDARGNGRSQVLRPARDVAARDAADHGRSTSPRSTRASASTALRSAAGRRSRTPTCSSCPTPRPRSSTLRPRRRRSRSSARSPIPITREPYAKDPRGVARRAEEHLRASGIADTAYFGPECEFFVFDEVHYDLGPNRSHYSVDSAGGLLELRQARARLHRSAEGGLLPGRALGHAPRPPHRDGADARADRDPVRVPPPRGRLGRPVRDRPPLHDADAHGRPGHDLQVRRQERRPPARQDRDVHAEADLRRQRLGHAHAPVAVDGRDAADGGQVRATRGSRSSRARTSAGCSPTRRRYSRSARRRRTRTGGSCRGSRRR